MIDFTDLANQCANQLPIEVIYAIVKTESGFNPFAIGIVGGRLSRQPRNMTEAQATARALDHAGLNYSVGLAQINRANFSWQNLTIETAFEPCKNLAAAQRIFKNCYDRASQRFSSKKQTLDAAYSCYFSGNFVTGFQTNSRGESYVSVIAQNTPGTRDSDDITVILNQTTDDKQASFITVTAQPGEEIEINSNLSDNRVQESNQPEKQPNLWDVFGDFK